MLTYEGGRLKRDKILCRSRDFEILSEPVWTALFSWYAGSPALPRNVNFGKIIIFCAVENIAKLDIIYKSDIYFYNRFLQDVEQFCKISIQSFVYDPLDVASNKEIFFQDFDSDANVSLVLSTTFDINLFLILRYSNCNPLTLYTFSA